jgi:hypothetical protein
MTVNRSAGIDNVEGFAVMKCSLPDQITPHCQLFCDYRPEADSVSHEDRESAADKSTGISAMIFFSVLFHF